MLGKCSFCKQPCIGKWKKNDLQHTIRIRMYRKEHRVAISDIFLLDLVICDLSKCIDFFFPETKSRDFVAVTIEL